MATRIIEYGGMGVLGAYPVVGQLVAEQAAMTANGTSALSAAFNNATALVCVQSDEAIYVKIDPALPATAVATVNSYRIPAGGEQFFSLSQAMVGAGAKVAIRT